MASFIGALVFSLSAVLTRPLYEIGFFLLTYSGFAGAGALSLFLLSRYVSEGRRRMLSLCLLDGLYALGYLLFLVVILWLFPGRAFSGPAGKAALSYLAFSGLAHFFALLCELLFPLFPAASKVSGKPFLLSCYGLAAYLYSACLTAYVSCYFEYAANGAFLRLDPVFALALFLALALFSLAFSFSARPAFYYVRLGLSAALILGFAAVFGLLAFGDQEFYFSTLEGLLFSSTSMIGAVTVLLASLSKAR